MLYATAPNGAKLLAVPGCSEAICPGCGAPVIAKCGEINIWHWAHKSDTDCDRWFEPESAWHLSWKQRVNPQQCEVVKGPHRADIVGVGGAVIELQHSSLSPFEAREREAFYGSMIWVVDAREFHDNLGFRTKRGTSEFYRSFRWKHPRKWMFAITKPLYWDFGDAGFRFFRVVKLHPNLPCGGYGYIYSREELTDLWLSLE